MATNRVIQLRRLKDKDWCGAALEAFDGLLPFESLVVVGDGDAQELLGRLQTDRKGLFEWSPLVTESAGFRVEVARRPASIGALRSVTEALGWDHDRLEALEKAAFESLAAHDLVSARANWAEFTAGLKRHIRFEELILFPRFEESVGAAPADGPTGVMRVEHREIERIIDAITDALEDDARVRLLRVDLHAALGQHNLKEEHVLYPGTDRFLSADERDTLVMRIQAT